MNANKWTMGLAALGLISIPMVGSAEEKMNQVWTALSSTTLSGYVNTSMHWNTGTGNGTVPAYSYGGSQKQDGFNLNAVKLTIEKPLDEAQWAAGYKAEIVFGPDAVAYNTTLDSAGDFSAAAIKQAYVNLRAPIGNGLDFKVGVFDTVIGYETFDAGSNPNYTRSYGFTIEPTTHTGVLASYQLCKFASVNAGIANTFGPILSERANPPMAESYKTYLASLALTAPEDWGAVSGSTLYAGVINGFNTSSSVFAAQTSWYVGATVNTPVKALKFGASYDYLGTADGTTYGGIKNGYANAWALYTSIQASEKLSFHLRGEYATTDTALLGTAANLPGGDTELFALTGTIQYDLWKNVLSRLEIRWDHQAGDGDMTGYGGSPATTFPTATSAGSGHKRNNVLLAANFIYKF